MRNTGCRRHHLERKPSARLFVEQIVAEHDADAGNDLLVEVNRSGNRIPNFPVKVSILDEGLVRAHREMPNIEAPPFFAMVLDHHGRINRWQTAISMAPSICMTDFGVYPVGTSVDNAYRSHVLHLLTPETESTTHYFWSIARNRRLDDDQLTQAIGKSIAQTFDEDGVVLAIQQKQLEKYDGSVRGVAMKVDEAPTRARRQLEALIKRENEETDFVYRPALMIEDTTPELAMV